MRLSNTGSYHFFGVRHIEDKKSRTVLLHLKRRSERVLGTVVELGGHHPHAFAVGADQRVKYNALHSAAK